MNDQITIFEKKKNIEVNNRLSNQFSLTSHNDFNNELQKDRFVFNTNKFFSKIFVVFRSLFILQC
jgi:hypothetical protein